ncbi:hypothetical protein C8Q78DRAFT_963648 [Trametes maxima]|nr:hypothetical protein C8Q78DRAFT_963648 [Trametes maxima]
MDDLDLGELFTFSPLTSPLSSPHPADSHLPPSSPPQASSPWCTPRRVASTIPSTPRASGTEQVISGAHAQSVERDDFPSSDSGPIASSPRVANLFKTKEQVIRRKAQKKRKETLTAQRAQRVAAQQERLHTDIAVTVKQQAEAAQKASGDREHCFLKVIEDLSNVGASWGELVEWICQPGVGHGEVRHEGMFRRAGQVERVLDLWVSSNSKTGKAKVHEWVLNYMGKVVGQEGQAATKSGILLTRRMTISESFVLDFDLQKIHAELRVLCPSMALLMKEFSTTRRQKQEANQLTTTDPSERDSLTTRAMEKKNQSIGTAMINLLGERSQRNSYVKHILGLYLYATGAQRQVLSMLSSLGFCSSYPSIAGSENFSEDEEVTERAPCDAPAERDRDTIENAGVDNTLQAPNPVSRLLYRGAGLLRRLLNACFTTSRACAQSKLCGHVYDNINMMFRIAEQILGRKDSQENGTYATIFPLYDAHPEDMQTADLLASLDAAPPLTSKDILHTPEEARLFQLSLEHAVMRDLVSRTDLFARFHADVAACLPGTDSQIPLHKTDVYPLPAMNIDESSITGNAEVVDTIFKSLGFDIGTTKFAGIVRPIFGDQLSISRLRSLMANRAGHESLARSYAFAAFGPGFFHHQMALTHGIIETHWGSASTVTASLHNLNTVLDRKPIILSSLPPYRTCRDLIFTCLSSCLLQCLERVCGHDSLAEYASTTTFPEFHEHVQLADSSRNPGTTSSDAVEHDAPTQSDDGSIRVTLTQGDMVFENACLFIRDALVLREFTDAIKGGYSGRIIRTLKLLALMYRGSGRTKYAYELLHLVHNLAHVWPKPLREIMIKNWLVNLSGKPGSWVPVDLLQEHMNFWIKVIYKANGSNASWDWLATISPCISLLRKLALEINGTLGARLGSKHHSPTLDKDFTALCSSLRTNNIFEVENGRVVNPENAGAGAVPNVMNVGLNQLQGPLDDYNGAFKQLQRRRRMTPLVNLDDILQEPSRCMGESSVGEVEADPRPEVSPNFVEMTYSSIMVTLPAQDLCSAGTGILQDHDVLSPEGDEDEEDEEEALWEGLEDVSSYDPREAFAAEENPSLDISDY